MSCSISYRLALIFGSALLLTVGGIAHAEVASIYGGRDGLCGHRTANGERPLPRPLVIRNVVTLSTVAGICALIERHLP